MNAVLTALRSRYFLFLLLATPLLVMSTRYANGTLFYGEIIHSSGEFSIRLMLLAMAATPLMLLFPGKSVPRWLLKNRRYLGVASFAYAALHTLVYLDKTALLDDVLADAGLLEYATGWLATLLMAALAVTSNDASVRWLKRRWKILHRGVYFAAIAAFLHWVLVAFNPLPAFLHIAILLGLEGYRVWKLGRIRSAAT